MGFEIAAESASGIDELKALWLQMLSQDRDLVGSELPLRADEQSWERARRDYRDWLTSDSAILLTARETGAGAVLGYAVCRQLPSGPTFDLGAARGNVDSLVVGQRAGGQGIGSALLEAVRIELRDRGIAYWSVGVLAHNTDALKLYDRVGFRPWTEELLASTHGPQDEAEYARGQLSG